MSNSRRDKSTTILLTFVLLAFLALGGFIGFMFGSEAGYQLGYVRGVDATIKVFQDFGYRLPETQPEPKQDQEL